VRQRAVKIPEERYAESKFHDREHECDPPCRPSVPHGEENDRADDRYEDEKAQERIPELVRYEFEHGTGSFVESAGRKWGGYEVGNDLSYH
jgi:hypothetical protein